MAERRSLVRNPRALYACTLSETCLSCRFGGQMSLSTAGTSVLICVAPSTYPSTIFRGHSSCERRIFAVDQRFSHAWRAAAKVLSRFYAARAQAFDLRRRGLALIAERRLTQPYSLLVRAPLAWRWLTCKVGEMRSCGTMRLHHAIASPVVGTVARRGSGSSYAWMRESYVPPRRFQIWHRPRDVLRRRILRVFAQSTLADSCYR